MTLEIKVGPPQLAVHQGYTVMVSDPDGQILTEGQKGLYFLDTRLISFWAMFADGVQWKLLNGGALAASAARVYGTNLPIPTSSGTIPENTLGLILGRHVDGGMHEDIDITNYGSQKVCFNLELAIRSDFADLFEVKGNKVIRRGEIASDWSPDTQELTTTYQHDDFSRALKVTASGRHSPMSYANGRLSFNVDLLPAASWHTCLLYDFANGERWSTAPKKCVDDYMSSEAARAQKVWKTSVLKVETDNYEVSATPCTDRETERAPSRGVAETLLHETAGRESMLWRFGDGGRRGTSGNVPP